MTTGFFIGLGIGILFGGFLGILLMALLAISKKGGDNDIS